MSVPFTLLMTTHGRRECFARTYESFCSSIVRGEASGLIVVDDSGDPSYREWLDEFLPYHAKVVSHAFNRGFAAAIETGWRWVLKATNGAGLVFHLEDDFVFEHQLQFEDLSKILYDNPQVVQVALQRQPVNAAERAAGGVVAMHPEAFVDRGGWLEHRQFFTTNPSLYRATLCQRVWPQVEHSEGVFTHRLLEDPTATFAYMGGHDEEPWVRHVGERTGRGY